MKVNLDEPHELRTARYELAEAEGHEEMVVRSAHACQDRLNKARADMDRATKELAAADAAHKEISAQVGPAHAARNRKFESVVYWEGMAKRWAENKAKEEGKKP